MGVNDFERLYKACQAKEQEGLRDNTWNPIDGDVPLNKSVSIIMSMWRVLFSDAAQEWRLKAIWSWNMNAATWAVKNRQPNLAEHHARTALKYQEALLDLMMSNVRRMV